jgi:hypothetical protein
LSQVFRYGLGPRAENLRNALDPAILDRWDLCAIWISCPRFAISKPTRI